MIKGDSSDYQLLIEAVTSSFKLIPGDYYLSCEIGVREGLGSQLMMDAAAKKNGLSPHHIGIDPYGNLKYAHYDDNKPYVADYTNQMKTQVKRDLGDYTNFHLIDTTDKEYMQRFWDGFPIYNDTPMLLDKYSCVHFDGPHKTTDVLRQALFFCDRSHVGTTFCFDDYKKYNMELIECVCMEHGFKEIKKGDQKKVLRKEYET